MMRVARFSTFTRRLLNAAEHKPQHDHSHGHNHGHGHNHEGPGGYFLGRVPGQVYPSEGWERSTYLGLFGGFVLVTIGLMYKPDTR